MPVLRQLESTPGGPECELRMIDVDVSSRFYSCLMMLFVFRLRDFLGDLDTCSDM